MFFFDVYIGVCFFFFFFKQKTAYEILAWLEFRRVLFRSVLIIQLFVSVENGSSGAMALDLDFLATPSTPDMTNKQGELSLYCSSIILLLQNMRTM